MNFSFVKKRRFPSQGEPSLPTENTPSEIHLSTSRFFLLLFLLGGILYVQTWGCPFVYDEYTLILNNAEKGAFQWKNLPALFSQRYFHAPGGLDTDFLLRGYYYRPFTILFHALSYKIFGPFYPVYHAESLFLHIGNTLLLFTLASLVLPARRDSPDQKAALTLGVLLFFVHPCNVETVSIVANQTILLCTFFSLVSLCCWAKLLGENPPSVILYLGSLLALLFAMLSKETGYIIPLLHSLLFLFLAGRKRKRMLLMLFGYFLLVTIPLLARHYVLQSPSLLTLLLKQLSRPDFLHDHLVPVMGLFFHQLHEWFLPLRTYLFQYPFSIQTFTLKEALFPCTVLLVLLFHLLREKRLLILCSFWFLLFYLPSSNLISFGSWPGGAIKAGSHHLYPAHAGLALIVSSALFMPPQHLRKIHTTAWTRIFSFPLSGLLILLLSIQTFRFASNFRDADWFYQGILERNPSYTHAWTNYGYHKLHLDKEPETAEWIILEGLDSLPDSKFHNRVLLRFLMKLYVRNGRPLETETLLQSEMDDWVTHPLGNLYFWEIIQGIERLNQQVPGNMLRVNK